ncbi:hypothetical protein GDO78_003597 [Eleutherodactylus coqui]|uniref:Uncharacterized protein n=1 Tax=Eleutherodactylus coqui TaxID=57060 RepID=A0A8J6EUK7_ELECQ|nr:hypothetical protein GDO78_003597 [Eleutherodactylus coqui]
MSVFCHYFGIFLITTSDICKPKRSVLTLCRVTTMQTTAQNGCGLYDPCSILIVFTTVKQTFENFLLFLLFLEDVRWLSG